LLAIVAGCLGGTFDVFNINQGFGFGFGFGRDSSERLSCDGRERGA